MLIINSLKVLRGVKKSFLQGSLFIPLKKSFVGVYYDILKEYFNNKVISPVTANVIRELIEKNILSPKPLQQFRYDFTDFSFNDIYMQNYDGRTYSRGFSKDINIAVAKALGEVFERQFTEFLDSTRVTINASVQEMNKAKVTFLDPLKYSKPTKKQLAAFPQLFSYTKDTKFDWVEVKKLNTNERTYLVAQDVCWGHINVSKETRVVIQGTGGCGGGYTFNEALESASFEVVQRDTFFRFWYFNKSPDSIIMETLPKNSDAYLMFRNLVSEGFKVHLLDMTLEAGLPVVTAVLEKENTGWFVGSSSGKSKIASTHRAIEEAFSTYMWMHQQIKNGLYQLEDFVEFPVEEGFIDRRISDKERCFLWGSKFYSSKQPNFLLNGNSVPFKEFLLGEHFSIANYLTEKFGDAYLVSSKNKLLEDYDYFSVKVMVPGAYNLPLVEVYSMSVLNNVFPQNNLPHPFP